MISLLMCISKKRECKEIENAVRNVVAVLADEELELIQYDKNKDIDENLTVLNDIHAIIVDVTEEIGFEIAKRGREHSSQIEIMIIADTTISPIKYLNPTVKASALLLKPFEKEMVDETVKSFIKQFVIQQNANKYEEMFMMKKRGEVVNVPCHNILYFEAREKKLYMKCRAKEYVLYESLDAVIDLLPGYFLKCHRSFLVNRMHIQNIKYSEGLIILDTKEMIPLSRSYKSVVKGVMAGEGN